MRTAAAESVAYHLSGWYERLRGKRLADLVTDPVCHMRIDPGKPPQRGGTPTPSSPSAQPGAPESSTPTPAAI